MAEREGRRMAQRESSHEELTEHSEDPAELEEEIQEEVEESLKDFNRKLVASLEVMTAKIASNAQAIERLTGESQVLDALAEPVDDPNTDDGEEDTPELQDMKDKAHSVIDRIWDKASGATKSNTGKFFLACFAIAASIGAEQLIDFIERTLNKKNAPPPEGMSKKDYEDVKQAIEEWAELSDSDYWKRMAKFAKKNKSTMADIVFFMQYTVKLFPAKEPFLWKKNSDQSRLGTKLVEAYKDTEDLPMWIGEELPGQKYQDESLPRSVTAQVARLALTHMIDEKV